MKQSVWNKTYWDKVLKVLFWALNCPIYTIWDIIRIFLSNPKEIYKKTEKPNEHIGRKH